GLGDLRRLDPVGGGGEIDRRRALFGDEDFDVGGVFGEEGAYGFEAHDRALAQSSLRRNHTAPTAMLTITVHYDVRSCFLNSTFKKPLRLRSGPGPAGGIRGH